MLLHSHGKLKLEIHSFSSVSLLFYFSIDFLPTTSTSLTYNVQITAVVSNVCLKFPKEALILDQSTVSNVN